MPDQFDQYAVKPQTTQVISASSDPFASYAVGGSAPSSAPVAPVSSSQGVDPFAAYATGGLRTNNGQSETSEPEKHIYQDETQPWYKRAGDWLNTPITESIFGLPETRPGASGLERGIEHIVSGLTSPLSIGLTAATFGTGGLLESAGMTALKESGEFGAEELPQILKAAQTAVDTYKAAPEGATAIADAVKAAGVDPALWNRAQTFLYDNGLSEHDLLGGNLLERGAFQVLRKAVPDLPVAATARAAKTANTLMNAGFTLQQLESASAMSPRFLDALKEGDYDKAMEYGTEVFASGALGVLGTSHALHSAGELFKPLIENDAFRPNDHWLQIDRANKEREAQHAVAEQEAINLDRQTREILGHADPGFLETVFGGSEEAKNRKNLELATVFHNVVTGGDRVKAAQWYNALSEALGREDRLPVPGEPGPSNGQLPPAAPNEDVQKLASDYTSSVGLDKIPHEGLMSVDPEAAKKVADAYDRMEHNPDDPETKAAYDALIRETKAQWDAAKAAGYKLEPWDRPGQPYADSREMAEDVRNNKHLFYFQGGDIPESHPLAGTDPETGETYNNIFRAVHDLFGHAKNGYEFGPRGEENAFLAHSRMYSDEAIPALLTETKGQNNWVNFGGHLRDENGNLPKKGQAGYVSPAERPFAEQKAGILPPWVVNPYLEKEPTLGQPIEQAPRREGTKVVHSNDAGEVRVGADGRPVVWLNPEAFEEFSKIVHPGVRFSGVSYSPQEAVDAAKMLVRSGDSKAANQVLDLFQEAQGASKHKLLAPIKKGAGVQIVSEELGHTWQRELSDIGDIDSHLKPQQWSRLRDMIPEKWTENMDRLGYQDDPVTRVAETAMQFMAGKAKGEIPDTDITRFLDAYYKEVVATHGPKALESLHKINEIAAQHVGDIDAQQARANAAAENRVANQRANRESLRRVEEGRQARPAEGRAGQPEGLASREEEQEFGKLSRLRLRGGMGDPNSAGLITGDNEVLVGRYHDDLAKEAGYKEPAAGKGNIHDAFFRDGGVRIRGAGGTIHIDFMEPNADTWDRVYQAVRSVPDANRYYVDFRPLKGARATGFNISAFDKDNLLFQLKDLEEGRQTAAPVGSVAYFRNGMFSREQEETPEFKNWFGDSKVVDEKGNPKVVYHGTKSDFDEFKHGLDYAQKTQGFGGFFFTENPEYAGQYGGIGVGSNIKPVYLRIKNPAPFDEYITELRKDRFGVIQRLKDKGYDGVVTTRGHEFGLPGQADEKTFVAFDPTQIKSAIGNRGTFDPRRRNILFSREGDFRDKEPRYPGLRSNGSRTWEEIKPFLNDEITKHDTPEKQDALTAAFNSLPDHQDYVEAIRAGRAGQMWYERSSRAFDALMDAGLDSLTKKDKSKFLNFVAALSPVQPVRSNLLMALNLWGKWDKAGRPTDVIWKDGVPKKNGSLYRLLKGGKGTQGVDLPARMNNAIRALQGEPLSGPKVSAFTTNLGKDVNRVTNDTWMAVFGGHDPNRINKPAVYDAMSAKIREAANATGIAPRQAQAAVWSFIKSLAELSGWGNDRWIPPQEIIRQGLLTPELVGMHSADFADLIQNDPEIRDAIKAIGGDLNVLDRKIKSYVPGKPAEGGPAEPNPQLLNAAERLEGARRDARVANHLARKQEGGLFDTEFRPNNGLFSREGNTSELARQQQNAVEKKNPAVNVELNFPVLKEDEPKWIEASKNEDIAKQFERLGIPGFSVDAPYKFGLSEQGNIQRSTGRIRISAAAEDPSETLSHELAHDIYNRLSEKDKSQINNYILGQNIEGQMSDLEERVVTHFADVILGRSGAPDSVRKVFLDSTLKDRPSVKEKPEENPPERALRAARSWSDIAQAGGFLYKQDDIRDIVSKDGDFPLVIKDTYGARHVVPASAASLILKDPVASGYVDQVWMDKDHIGEQSDRRLHDDVKKYQGMLDAGRYLGMNGNPDGIPLDERGKEFATQGLQEAQKELSRRSEPGYKYSPRPVERENPVRIDNRTGAKPLLKAIGVAERTARLTANSGQPSGLFSKEDPQLQHQIDTNVFKNQPKDYQDLVMDSLRRNAMGELSNREIQASKRLKDEQDRNYEIGSSNDLLHHYIEDYMTRVYKDTNPQGQVILSDAKGGKFATNVTMAKQRVYDSNLTALLKSPKQMLLDPVQITARGRASLIKAAANRQLIDNLRDKFTRASDGRPAVVLSGSGQVISGQNGEDPRMFIDPNRVRKINIDPNVIKTLSASGDLDRYLANGTIRDITPYVRPNNIGAAIDRLEEQAGKRTPAPDEHGQNPLRTQIMLLKSMQANGDFRGLKDFNDALEKKYVWSPQDYISLANGAMKGWNFITNSPDGTPIYVRSNILVHPEFAEYLQNRLGLAPSDIAKNPVGKTLLGAGAKAKETLLSLSPFHTVQIALRGLMTGINPFTLNGPDILDGAKVDPSDPSSPTKLRKMVEQGYTTGTDYKALQEHSEGLSGGHGLLRKIPGVGPVLANSLDFYNNFLFKRFIPAVKATAAEHLFDEYRKSHPDWSVDRIAKAAALHSNENFGGINWRAMGRSATTQDWGRLLALAPDWLESELRAGARLFNKDEGNIGRRQVAIMTMALWGIARTLNLMNSGNMHVEAPFGLVTKTKDGKEIIYSVRTLPEDLLHAATQPVQFLKGRLSPGVRTGTELVTGRDSFGRKLQPSDLWVDVTRNLFPIPAQSIGQALTNTGPEVGNVGQFVKAIGGTAQSYASPAEKLAADLAANHTEDGPVDPSQMARHRTILQFEDKLRSGEMSLPDVYRMYAAGELHEDDLKKITENAKKTKGLSAPLASLYSRASRLPGPEYLQLYDQMNNSEKAALAPLTLQVRKRYIAKAMKNLRPEERLHDPTFMRFLNMVTDQSPF